jgi:hypothetical protein
MNDTVVLFVTRTGNSRRLAEKIASHYGVRAREIVDLEDRKGLSGFMKAGAQSFKGEASRIVDPRADLSSASRVVLVQPMWAFSACPPLRTWLSLHVAELKGKMVGLLTSQFGTPAKAMRKKFEEDFVKLDAFTMIPEKLEEKEKDRLLAEFTAALKNP